MRGYEYLSPDEQEHAKQLTRILTDYYRKNFGEIPKKENPYCSDEANLAFAVKCAIFKSRQVKKTSLNMSEKATSLMHIVLQADSLWGRHHSSVIYA